MSNISLNDINDLKKILITLKEQIIEYLIIKERDLKNLLNYLEKNEEYFNLKEEIFKLYLIICEKIKLLNPPKLNRCTGMNDCMYIRSVNSMIKEIKDYINNNNLVLDEKITQLEDCIIFSNELNQFEKNNDLSEFYLK
jgi:hypothetical protein